MTTFGFVSWAVLIGMLAGANAGASRAAEDSIQGWDDVKLGMTLEEVQAADPGARSISRLQFLTYAEVLGTECIPDEADRRTYDALGLPPRTDLTCDVLMSTGSAHRLQFRTLFFFARRDRRLETIQVTTELLRPEMPARLVYAELTASAVRDFGPPTATRSGELRTRAGRWFATVGDYCSYLTRKGAEKPGIMMHDFVVPRLDWSAWIQLEAELAIRIYDTYWRLSPECPKPQDHLDSDGLLMLAQPFAMIQIHVQRRGEGGSPQPAPPPPR